MSPSRTQKPRRPSSTELSSWFHRACAMEPGALQQLLRLYRPLLLKRAHQSIQAPIRPKVAPSDLVQATAWKVTQAFPQQKFAERSAFVAWLLTILKNEAEDARRRYRKAKKRDVSRERPLFGREARQWLRQLSASVSGPGSHLSDKLSDLPGAIKRLPAHYQLVLRLRYFDRLKFESIGARLERSADAARVLHNRALKRLRQELNRHDR